MCYLIFGGMCSLAKESKFSGKLLGQSRNTVGQSSLESLSRMRTSNFETIAFIDMFKPAGHSL